MTWRDGRFHGRDSYHHGNLREALVTAAVELIGSSGTAGFSFAEVARAAGVSPAAPYRHFRDRQALVAEVARRGFEQFRDDLSAAWDDGRPDPHAAFVRMGRAYLEFARAHPAFYAAMFEAPPGIDAALEIAGDRAFAVLRDAVAALGLRDPAGHPAPSLTVALHIWALSHGIASLFLGRGGSARPLPGSPEDLLEAGVRIYLRGLTGPP